MVLTSISLYFSVLRTLLIQSPTTFVGMKPQSSREPPACFTVFLQTINFDLLSSPSPPRCSKMWLTSPDRLLLICTHQFLRYQILDGYTWVSWVSATSELMALLGQLSISFHPVSLCTFKNLKWGTLYLCHANTL